MSTREFVVTLIDAQPGIDAGDIETELVNAEYGFGYVMVEERRADPTLDELLARARERWGDGINVGIYVTGSGTYDVIVAIGDGPMAVGCADTAIGALRAAVGEGR